MSFKKSNEVMMQCLACCNKRIDGINPSRSNGRSPLTETERTDIYRKNGFCRREPCQHVRNQVLNYPWEFKEQFEVILTEYVEIIDAFFSPIKCLLRPEFTLRRMAIKKKFKLLRKAVDDHRFDLAYQKQENEKQENEKQENDETYYYPPCPIASNMQCLVNNYITHIRGLNADINHAKEYWTVIFELPISLFDAKMKEPLPLGFVSEDDFASYFCYDGE